MDSFTIKVNEKEYQCNAQTSLAALAVELKPDADLFIVNGFPQSGDYSINHGDEVILIKRGEVPSSEEMASLLRARQTPGLCDTLQNSVVGIAGVGGLGSNIAISLARCGVGELIIVDYDVVEPSNLNRQAYLVKHIGQPKVLALKEIIAEANPYVKISAHLVELSPSLVKQIFNRVNVLVEAFDRAEAKAMLLESLRRDLPQIPGVFASGLAGDGPSAALTTKRVYNNIYLIGDGVSAAAPYVGLLAPRVMLAAGMQANAVLRLLQDKDPLNDEN